MRKFDYTSKAANLCDHTHRLRPINLLEEFEKIVEYASDSHLDDNFLERVRLSAAYASKKLNLTPMQVILLAIFVDRSDDQNILLSELANFTGCRTTKMLRLLDDIDVLVREHYIASSVRDNTTSYRVPGDVLTSLRKNEPYVYTQESITCVSDFFDYILKLKSQRESGQFNYQTYCDRIDEALDQIKTTQLAAGLRRYNLDMDEKVLFLTMASLFAVNFDDNIMHHDIEDIYDRQELPGWCKRGLRSRTLDLFKKRMIENSFDNGMARPDGYKLTENIKEELLGELELNLKTSHRGLINHDELPEKKLVYNADEESQIGQLSKILSKKRFTEVQSRLKKAGMREGFCCIFYGGPGTGKTETVYQLARKTGRDILRVDVDKIKSCWVGDSEKNVKALFDRYRSLCREMELAPILLFNEADAVLGVRKEGASSAVDKMENSLQNIILQEMESLEGIMIATTNLTCNLDKAFERRFLYKIKFNKPTTEARTRIWRHMLRGLTMADARSLAAKFDLSGGEIENIVRKHTVNTILSGREDIDINALIELCTHECIAMNTRERIGFAS